MRATAATRRLSTTSTTSCATCTMIGVTTSISCDARAIASVTSDGLTRSFERVRGARLDDVSGHVDACYGLKSPAVSVFTPVS